MYFANQNAISSIIVIRIHQISVFRKDASP